MSEKKIVTSPSGPATRAISLRSSSAHLVKSSIEAQQRAAHALLAHPGRRSRATVLIARPAACTACDARGLRGAPGTAWRAPRLSAATWLVRAVQLGGQHDDRADGEAEQHPEDDCDGGDHGPRFAQAEATAEIVPRSGAVR